MKMDLVTGIVYEPSLNIGDAQSGVILTDWLRDEATFLQFMQTLIKTDWQKLIKISIFNWDQNHKNSLVVGGLLLQWKIMNMNWTKLFKMNWAIFASGKCVDSQSYSASQTALH